MEKATEKNRQADDNKRRPRTRSRFMSSPTLKIDFADDMIVPSTGDDGSGEDEEEPQIRISVPNTFLHPSRCRLNGRRYHWTYRHSRSISYPGLWDGNKKKNENIYRGLLRSLLHPLGAPDKTVGLRPGDLVDHLREVFEVDRDEHEFFIKDELSNKPKCLQANITVLEGDGLKQLDGSKELGDPYCMVSIIHPMQRNLKVSPMSSPRNSPKLSPKARKTSSTLSTEQQDDVLRTVAVKQSTSPHWNEEFQLSIDELLMDEIHVYICDQEEESHSNGEGKHSADSKHTTVDKHHGIKHNVTNLFRLIRQMADHDKHHDGCWGRVVIPVRDVPAHGCAWWWDIHPLSGGSKSKSVGRIRLKLDISHRMESDCEAEECFSVEDYYQATQQIYEHAAKTAKESEITMEAHLPAKERRILDSFAISHKIGRLSQAVVHVIVLLEWTTTNENIVHTELALTTAIQDLQMTWVTQQIDVSTVTQKMPLTDAEISMYRKAATKYILWVSDHLEKLPVLFPPTIDNINILKAKLGITIQLVEIDLWETKSAPLNNLTTKVLNKLQEDVDEWMDIEVAAIKNHDLVKDAVIPELNALGELVNSASSHLNSMGVVKTFFTALGIIYYRVVSFAVEKKVSPVMKELMMEMDRYQRRYHNFPVNVTASSRLSLRVYFAVRKFYNIIRDNISRRDVFRLSISHYQQWYQEALVFWVQSFRTECTNRIERALEIDKDVVVATSLVKFSNSSVDVLSCFAKITEEWRQIDFHDPDSALMGVTKITDLICDGARMYGEKIHSILERNCYYDDSVVQFDVTDRLCITLNNIEHVRQYLTELPHLLDWDSIVMLISTRYENDDVGNQALSTLKRLMDTANKEIILKSSLLLQQITEKMKVDIARYMEIFTIQHPEKASSVDQLIGYLSTNLSTLHDRLMSSIFPRMILQLWETVVTLLDQQLQVGKRPEYYQQMKQHVRALTSYFVRGGCEDDKIDSFHFEALKQRIDTNCMSTEELMLAYLKSLADNIETPLEYFGHLALKTAYLEETRGNITLFVKVIRATDLPGLDPSGLSDPYVVTSVLPQTMFGHHKPQKTRVVEKSLNPVFNATFQFPNIPQEFLTTKGAVVLLSVLDHDHIGQDDFAGEVVLHLSGIERINMSETVDAKPVVMMAVKRSVTPTQGPYKVLMERMSWDRSAKNYVMERRRYLDVKSARTDQPSKMSNFFSFLKGPKT
ncbi:protein unc-13 homolog D-like isoform X1 [Mizuhopecten yessoensis]|uniref:Protein unc-13-like D n=1 Tax=Mizuhopecten yessoensis TaxID=6573 RepID=A0A210QCW1_MIZYE|nr:protein unc-13 homolog D-like isoform X1 [Mizuhopecten yessoensis]OWF46560.1 Protein unc-13-like D [Mizuhopecten yessoensis]